MQNRKTEGKAIMPVAAGIFLSLIIAGTTGLPSYAWFARHPRRAQVLSRDGRINNRLNRDRGSLDGHYGQLKREDAAIRYQEQSDARANGGYITRPEQRQLNHEENRLDRQIRRDR